MPGGGEHPDREREDELHQPSSAMAAGASVAGALGLGFLGARPAAERLVRQRDEHDDGGADDQREDAEVEEERGGDRHVADDRQRDVARARGQERVAEEQRPRPGGRRRQQPRPHPAHRQDAQPVLDPAHVGGEVLQEEADGERHPGGEAAARQVVPAQEEIGRERDDRREHPLHHHRGHAQVVVRPCRRARGRRGRRRRSGCAAARASRCSRAPGGSGAAARRR